MLPPVVRAQQPTTLPVVGFIYGGSADGDARFAVAFRKGLNETGSFEGQNVIEYHWLAGQYERPGRCSHARIMGAPPPGSAPSC